MFSEKWWAVIGIAACLVTTLLVWSTIKLFKFCKSKKTLKVVENNVAQEANNVVSIIKTVPTIEENGHFLPDADVTENLTTKGLQNSVEESRYLSQTSRDLSWLDTWQTKTHRRSEFAKSMMALILPPHAEGTHEGSSVGLANGIENHDEFAGEKEMFVVPANMTTGMCDHNLAMGLFLWSPSKNKSKGSVEGEAGSVTSTYVDQKIKQCTAQKSDSLNTYLQCTCGLNHAPLSPITVPSSATMSALSSAKSSQLATCPGPDPSPNPNPNPNSNHGHGHGHGHGLGPGFSLSRMPHHDVRNRTPNKREIHSELREMFAHYAATPSTLSSNLSLSALSPPPPSSASSMSPQLSNRGYCADSCYTWEQTHRAVYPLRYHHHHQLKPMDPSTPYRTSRLMTMTDNMYQPITREEIKPCLSTTSLVGEKERKDCPMMRSVFTADSLPRRAGRCTAPYE